VESLQRIGGERVVDPAPATGRDDKSGLAEHLEVVAEEVGGERRGGIEFADASFALVRELPKDAEPRRVRDSGEE